MDVRKRIVLFGVGAILLHGASLYSIFPINFLRPYDEVFYRVGEAEKFQLYGVVEHGFKSQGRNDNGDVVSPFALWQCDQSALAMLKGFSADTAIGQLAQQFNIDGDDGVRGHFATQGCVEHTSAVISARYYLPHNLSLSVHLPVHSVEVKDVCWIDQTKDITFEDKLIKQNLTDNFCENVYNLGCLDLDGWKKTGVGDIVLAGQWLKEFPQVKRLLRTVTLNVRAGMSLPTAKECYQDRVLSIPFGNDDAFGLFVAGGIDLKWDYHIRAGIDAQFLHLFGSTRERRIKTDPSQSDLLLLQKVRCRRDFGITQRYNVFLEFYRFLRGLSVRATYQFWQHNEDAVSLFTNDFSEITANTASRFDDWTMHNIIFSANYEVAADVDEDTRFKPQFSFYYRLPINGVRSILTHAIGGALVVNF